MNERRKGRREERREDERSFVAHKIEKRNQLKNSLSFFSHLYIAERNIDSIEPL